MASPRFTRRSAERALLLAFAIVALLLAPAAALAHPMLDSVAPPDGAEIERAPEAIVITYSKALGDLVDGVELQPPAGDPIDDAWTVDGARIIVTLPPDPPSGTWRVSWRVTGADGHPMRDESSFDLHHATSSGTGGDYPRAAVERVGYAGRAAFFGGLLVFVGGQLFAMLVAPGWRTRAAAPALLATVLGAWLALAAHVSLVDDRGLVGMLDPRAWIVELGSPAVRGWLLAAALVVVAHARRGELSPATWQRRRGALPRLQLAIVASAAAAPALSGHAVDGEWLILRIPFDALHVLAGAAWLGGLVQLHALTAARGASIARIAASARRYSRVAMTSVITLVVTGAWAVLDEVAAGPGELLDSTWGRLVLAKLLLLAATMPLARINHTRNVPDLADQQIDAIASLRRLVVVEVVLLAWVVLATAALVNATPPT